MDTLIDFTHRSGVYASVLIVIIAIVDNEFLCLRKEMRSNDIVPRRVGVIVPEILGLRMENNGAVQRQRCQYKASKRACICNKASLTIFSIKKYHILVKSSRVTLAQEGLFAPLAPPGPFRAPPFCARASHPSAIDRTGGPCYPKSYTTGGEGRVPSPPRKG